MPQPPKSALIKPAPLSAAAVAVQAHQRIMAAQHATQRIIQPCMGRPPMQAPVIQRSAAASHGGARRAKVMIGTTEYDCDIHDQDGTYWLVVTLKTGKKLFLNYRKSIEQLGGGRYKLKDSELPYVEQYLRGTLVLHRGVDSDHITYADARQGRLPAKPTANLDVPDFTSESSTTRFIPFSTDRRIAVMAGRAVANRAVGDISNTQVGAVVSVRVGPERSLGVFDSGEIQVLDPPVGEVSAIRGATIGPGNLRVDGVALTAAAAFNAVRERIAGGYWDSLGVGWFGRRMTPDGIGRMRAAVNFQSMLNIAGEKLRNPDRDRNPEVDALYREVKALGDRVGLAARVPPAPSGLPPMHLMR